MEHFFIYLFAIWTSSLVRCPVKVFYKLRLIRKWPTKCQVLKIQVYCLQFIFPDKIILQDIFLIPLAK